jgi:hypothetical protein
MFNYAVLFFPLSLFVLWLSALVGTLLRSRRPLIGEEREDFGFVQAAALTLLGLIIGFSFSMAIGRYDQRRNYEEAEANAIGTEFVRAGRCLRPTLLECAHIWRNISICGFRSIEPVINP